MTTAQKNAHTRNLCLCLLPKIDPTDFMRVKMNIALRKRTLSPVRLVLEDSSKRSFMLFVVVSLQLGSIIQSNLPQVRSLFFRTHFGTNGLSAKFNAHSGKNNWRFFMGFISNPY